MVQVGALERVSRVNWFSSGPRSAYRKSFCRKSFDSDGNLGSAERKSFDSDLNLGSAERKSFDSSRRKKNQESSDDKELNVIL